jgi:Uma2 family endonuclease
MQPIGEHEEINGFASPLWKKSSTVTQAASVPLVIEVVSTNWQDDYAHKLVDYEILGIPEYWIIDYLGLCCGMCSKFRIWICCVMVAIASGIICG